VIHVAFGRERDGFDQPQQARHVHHGHLPIHIFLRLLLCPILRNKDRAHSQHNCRVDSHFSFRQSHLRFPLFTCKQNAWSPDKLQERIYDNSAQRRSAKCSCGRRRNVRFRWGFFVGDILEVFWPDVFTTMTATADARINDWLHGADIIPILVGGIPLY
jgi:hypothetical protein